MDAVVFALLFATVALASYLAGARQLVPRPHEDGCICWGCADDFDLWESELDEDDSGPALITALPVSDEYLLDVWHSTRDPEVAR